MLEEKFKEEKARGRPRRTRSDDLLQWTQWVSWSHKTGRGHEDTEKWDTPIFL